MKSQAGQPIKQFSFSAEQDYVAWPTKEVFRLHCVCKHPQGRLRQIQISFGLSSIGWRPPGVSPLVYSNPKSSVRNENKKIFFSATCHQLRCHSNLNTSPPPKPFIKCVIRRQRKFEDEFCADRSEMKIFLDKSLNSRNKHFFILTVFFSRFIAFDMIYCLHLCTN